jgi:hypothetical protein
MIGPHELVPLAVIAQHGGGQHAVIVALDFDHVPVAEAEFDSALPFRTGRYEPASRLNPVPPAREKTRSEPPPHQECPNSSASMF